MASVTLTGDDFKVITKITSRPQIVVYIALLSLNHEEVQTSYLVPLLNETYLSKGTIAESLRHLAWDGHIEKMGDCAVPFPDCPISITSRKS